MSNCSIFDIAPNSPDTRVKFAAQGLHTRTRNELHSQGLLEVKVNSRPRTPEDSSGFLGGSGVVISGVISKVTILITHI